MCSITQFAGTLCRWAEYIFAMHRTFSIVDIDTLLQCYHYQVWLFIVICPDFIVKKYPFVICTVVVAMLSFFTLKVYITDTFLSIVLLSTHFQVNNIIMLSLDLRMKKKGNVFACVSVQLEGVVNVLGISGTTACYMLQSTILHEQVSSQMLCALLKVHRKENIL